MFLKSVEIFGFKSFADRAMIEFTDGIACLLGPNGCGKSNVVDAIKWVLGEQSTKSLRAEKMEDVIFNGTENRKALNVAEVTLTLSNSEGILQLDMPEVSIKRRLYRNGDSEYLINNMPSKLKEVRELFFDTGIGKSAYSIMEQGKIDQVLSNKPEERRYIFEEAAGLTKYRYRGQEAEKKLEKTEEHMRQVESVQAEVKRSHDSLKNQSEKTTKFRQYKDEIFQTEIKIQLLRLKEFIEQKNKKDENLKEKSAERDALKAEIDKINENLEENLDLVNNMESDLINKQKHQYGIDLEKNNKSTQISLLEERKNELNHRIQAAMSREKSVSDQIAYLVEEKQKKLTQKTGLENRVEEIQGNILDFQTNIENAVSRVKENEKVIQDLTQKVRECVSAEEQFQTELRSITDDIVTQLDARLKQTGYSMKERLGIEEKIKDLFDKIHIQLQGKIALVSDATTLKNTEKSEAFHNVEEALLEITKYIESMQKEFDAYQQTTPKFLDEFLAPEGIITKKRSIDENIIQLRETAQKCRDQVTTLTEENKTLSSKIDEYRKTLEDLRVNMAQVRAQIQSLTDLVQNIDRQIGEQKKIQEENQKEIFHCKERLGEIDNSRKEAENALKELDKQHNALLKELEKLEGNITKKNKDLMNSERIVKEKVSTLGKIQGQLEKIQMDLASITTEIKNLYDNFRENHSRDLSEFEGQIYELRDDLSDLKKQMSVLKESQRALGHVNLMAPEEYAEVKERYDFLVQQLDDLKKAREDLRQVTQEIKQESTELFLATYDKIRKNFHTMFRRLFGGGRGELKLTDQSDVLESGIEIYAQPPGKKLENISLLSGGERSMAGVALLFATFMVKPSPFCILDEIDAALDEANVVRFVSMLNEFSRGSQFIVITHNKKTVTGAKTLLGVTMEESGVSKIIAIKVDNHIKEERPMHPYRNTVLEKLDEDDEEDSLDEDSMETDAGPGISVEPDAQQTVTEDSIETEEPVSDEKKVEQTESGSDDIMEGETET